MKIHSPINHPLKKENFFDAQAPTKSQIGANIRALRKERALTQGGLARVLKVSQSNLSEIESGKASLTAEQFIVLLKFFNVPVSTFEHYLVASGDTLHKALAFHGANNLVENPNILPSERLANVETAIREVLVEGGPPRSLTALAPVFLQNVGHISFTRLYARLKNLDLDLRYLWLLDNLLVAFRIAKHQSKDRKATLALSKAENTLQRYRDHVSHLAPPPHTQGDLNYEEDDLGQAFASNKSAGEVRRKSSQISRQWGILTTLQPEDFAHAIQESLDADAR